jgi:outer membrane biosynthesis protein TonB
MSTCESLRLARMLLLLVISTLFAACSSSQSTVVEPKSEIGAQAVSGTMSSGATKESGFSVAELKGTGVSAQQAQSSAGMAGGQAYSADQQSPGPVSAPVTEPTGTVTVPTVSASAENVPAQTQTQPQTQPQPQPQPQPQVESPPQARKLLVDRQVIIDLGRASGKVIVQ